MENEVKYYRENQLNKKSLLFSIKSKNKTREKQFWTYIGCSLLSGLLGLLLLLCLPVRNEKVYINELKSIIIFLLALTFMVIEVYAFVFSLHKMNSNKRLFRGNYFDLDQNNLSFKAELNEGYKLNYEIYSFSVSVFIYGLIVSLLGVFLMIDFNNDIPIDTLYALDIFGFILTIVGIIFLLSSIKTIDKGDFEGDLPSIEELELEGYYYTNRPSIIIKPKQPKYPK